MKRRNIISKVLLWMGGSLIGIILLFLVVLALNTDFSKIDDLQKDVDTKARKAQLMGISVAFIKGDQVDSTLQYGYADFQNSINVDENTVFQIASVSKTVTAVAVLQLYEKGLLNLDDNINDYLPYDIVHPYFPQKSITFRMLLSHTAGIDNNYDVYESFYTISSGGGDSPISLEDFVKEFLLPGGRYYDADKNFTKTAPGEAYFYSNPGYGLLGYLVEEISGMSFSDYCHVNIFEPLDMKNTTWLLKDTDINNLAIPYDENNSALPHYSFPTYPDGALKTTPTEYSHLLIAMQNDGHYKNATILKPETIADMLTPVANNNHQALGWDYAVLDELFMKELNNGHQIGHTGGDPGVLSVVLFNPVNKTGVVVFMNKTISVDLKLINKYLLLKRILLFSGICQ